MAVEMKELIEKAAKTLLFEKKVKRLTVKDIVEECNITRQAFYYHFEDIPDLLQWAVERDSEKILQECLSKEDVESGLQYFMAFAINARPYVEQGMNSNYGEEIEKILTGVVYGFFERVTEDMNLYQEYNPLEQKYILRYHSQAIMGIVRGWTPEDTGNMEQIVHTIYLLLCGKVSPLPEK